jgi:hypothetical protein
MEIAIDSCVQKIGYSLAITPVIWIRYPQPISLYAHRSSWYVAPEIHTTPYPKAVVFS